MFIYRRIRDLREDNDKTQSQIAKVLNMQLTVYQRYERGKTATEITAANKQRFTLARPKTMLIFSLRFLLI